MPGDVGQDREELGFVHQVALEQHGAQSAAAHDLKGEGVLQVAHREQTLLNEHGAEARAHGRSCRWARASNDVGAGQPVVHPALFAVEGGPHQPKTQRSKTDQPSEATDQGSTQPGASAIDIDHARTHQAQSRRLGDDRDKEQLIEQHHQDGHAQGRKQRGAALQDADRAKSRYGPFAGLPDPRPPPCRRSTKRPSTTGVSNAPSMIAAIRRRQKPITWTTGAASPCATALRPRAEAAAADDVHARSEGVAGHSMIIVRSAQKAIIRSWLADFSLAALESTL